jgi:hypothetical protein
MSEGWVDLTSNIVWSGRNRTLQVFQCYLCGAWTNLVESSPVPCSVCPHRAKAWHDEIKTIWHRISDARLSGEERHAGIAAIGGILAAHAHPDDVVGRADRSPLYHFGRDPEPCVNGCVYFHFGIYPVFSRERGWHLPEDPQR